MRCTQVVALLLTGSSVVSAVPPHFFPFTDRFPDAVRVQVKEIIEKCPQPVLDHMFNLIGKYQAENDTAPFWVGMARIASTCELLYGKDLAPHEHDPINPYTHPNRQNEQSFFGQIADIAVYCPKDVLDITLDAIEKYEAEHPDKNNGYYGFDLAKTAGTCELPREFHRRSPPAQLAGDLPIASELRRTHSPFYQLADVGRKCRSPVWGDIPDIITRINEAHKAGNDTTPLWLELALLAHTCEVAFPPNTTIRLVGPSDSSTHDHSLVGRQQPNLELGRRYTPADPNFLSAVTQALYDRRWAFYYDNHAFYTAHVAEALTHHAYERIYTSDQERLMDDMGRLRVKYDKKQRKAEKKRLKEKKKADKKVEKELLKHMTHDQRKKYKKDKKAAEKAKKANKKHIKEEYKKVYDDARQAEEARVWSEREREKTANHWASKVIQKEQDEYFENGGGPAIGQDNIQF